MTGQVVDTLSAQAFMREALGRISAYDLDAIADECEAKHRAFRALLDPGRPSPPGEDGLRFLLRRVFATRRLVADLFGAIGSERLGREIQALVVGDTPLVERFQAFVDALAALPGSLPQDLASECLHYTDPDRYWLWTRWVWDPGSRTGALPLVTTDGHDLTGATAAETYLRVGQALAFVQRTGEAAGFTQIGRGRLGIDVYLACVYGVYVHTAVGLRITREFTRVIPPLPELCRRLLGVHKMEALEG